MSSYFNSLFSLFRKHYVENRNSYFSLMLGLFGLPLLIVFVKRDSVSAVSMGMSLAILTIGIVTYLSTRDLRKRESFIISTTLPISTVVRYSFVLLNSTVVTFAIFVLLFGVSIGIAKWLYPPMPEFDWVFSELFFTNYYSIMGLWGTHAVLFFINLYSRVKPLYSYAIAIFVTAVVQVLISRYAGVEYRADFKLCINILLIFVCWIGGYFALRNYQLRS